MSRDEQALLRTRVRDLAAASAFGSIAISGSIPAWATATFALALFLGFLGKRPLAERVRTAILALALAAVVLFGLALRGQLDLVVAACSFASLIAAYRMLAAPSRAADRQVLLTGLLMVAGGSALTGEIYFALFLAAFAQLGCMTLALGSVEDSAAPGEAMPTRPLLLRAGLGAAFAIVGGAAFFVAFPRLSWNLASRRHGASATATTGFADTVRLFGGSIKTDPRAVARVKLSPDPEVERLDAYWFGRAFDTFDGHEWSGSGKERPRSATVRLRAASKGLVRQDIQLLPAYEASTLFALEPAVLLGNAIAHTPAGNVRALLVEVRGEEVRIAEEALSYSYQAHSLATPAGEEPPADAERYLGLPKGFDPRIRELAQRLAAGETEPHAAAAKLAARLRAEYRYALDLSGESEDPLADFLFARKEGHCQHFATALAVMLRTLGHPSRVVGGFFGGERAGEEYVLRAGDAHAWTQVHVPGRGFVTVDATPEANRAAQPSPFWEYLAFRYEELDALWRAWVLDYSLRDQVDLVRSLVRPPRQAVYGPSHLPSPRRWLIAALVLLAVYAAWRGRGALLRPQRHRASTFLDGIERALARAGIRERDGETIEELCARLVLERHALAGGLSLATRRYVEARFGGRPLLRGERERLLAALNY